jgi:hypothetical protein
MQKNCGLYLLTVLLGLLLLCAPVAAQAASHTTLQVYTDETVLGRVVSITPASDIGAYAITITRGTSVQPAMVGDTLRHKDIITIQRGSFADIQLVDRSDKTMLGGGTGGTAILLERAGGSFGGAATPEATVSDGAGGIVYVETEYSHEVGTIKFIEGKATIFRGGGNLLFYPASVSASLLDGDRLDVKEGYVVVELHDSRVLTVYEGNKLSLFKKETQKPESFLDPVFSFFGDIWTRVKDAIASVEAQIPTATAGVRG